MRTSGKRPDGAIRRSQILTRAGPGAPVDLVDSAVVISGLEAWRYASDHEGFLDEPRLEVAAHRLLLATDSWNRGRPRLRQPPDCDDNDAWVGRGIGAVEFPSWFVCQSHKCRSIVHWRGLNEKRRHTCSSDHAADFPVVPLRFVAACPRGHLTDVYWHGFIHRGVREEGVGDDEPKFIHCRRRPGSGWAEDLYPDSWNADLYMISVGVTGDMADYVVGCRRCGATRGLQDLSVPRVLGMCQGWRPWLGHLANESCEHHARLLIRTASNAYFPQNISVLSIPDSAEGLKRLVGEHWAHLEEVRTAEDLSQCLRFVKTARGLAEFDEARVLDEIRRRRDHLPEDANPIREAEWQALMEAPAEISGELPRRDEAWVARRAEGLALPPFVDRVVLVHALREVRAQVGFTRLEGQPGDAEGDFALDGQTTAALSLNTEWIPAVEILGEGVLIAFDEAEVRRWEARPEVQARDEAFRRALKAANESRGQEVPYPGIRLILLHSLSHLLITEISLACGYPASSIRERLYCHRDEDPDEASSIARSRAGILLYTGTPGSEGTLGGLVEEGRNIVDHLRRAARSAMLCSNDPICAQHDPQGLEEGREREGAACHACLLIAEPSCERMNRDLDRAVVVPTVDSAALSFLGNWAE